jgi:hypothetical protein
MAELPFLCDMVRAFFRGAHRKWVTFAEELAKDGVIAKLSPAQRRRAFMDPTNDVNEGALGMLRVAMRRCPNMSLFGHNARFMMRQNNTVVYLRSLTPIQRTQSRKKTREWARGNLEKSRRLRLADLRFKTAERNAQKVEEQAREAAERRVNEAARLRNVIPILDCSKVGTLKGSELDLQIEWHRAQNVLDPKTRKNLVCRMSKLRVQDKKYVLYGLIGQHRARGRPSNSGSQLAFTAAIGAHPTSTDTLEAASAPRVSLFYYVGWSSRLIACTQIVFVREEPSEWSDLEDEEDEELYHH